MITSVTKQEGLKAIQVAALRGNTSVLEILLPVTSQIQTVPQWSVDGIIEHMQSDNGKAQVCNPCMFILFSILTCLFYLPTIFTGTSAASGRKKRER